MTDNPARSLPPDIEIARAAKMLADRRDRRQAGHRRRRPGALRPVKAKVSLDLYHRLDDAPTGKLVLVTAITPTPAGEGKTTTSIGLADGLNRIGKRATVCLREPSMGPCFGMKGGAAGGGYAQVVPMEDINLHFTGDIHAIELAHNLLAAMLDNHLHHGNELRHRSAAHHLGPRGRHERPRAAEGRSSGWAASNNSMPHESTLRHHRGLRGDGHLLPLRVARRAARAARADHRRPTPATEGPSPPPTSRPTGR